MPQSVVLHHHPLSLSRSLILLLFIVAFLPVRADGQWVEKSAEGFTTAEFAGVSFPTPATGYAIGSLSGQHGLFKTVNGGDKWTGVGLNDMWLFGIDFTDENNGYLCGRWTIHQCGVILRTTNAGKSWTPDTVQGTHGLYTVEFPTKSIGYACGYLGVIVKTTNGGGSWSRLNTGTATDVFTDISFASADVGMAISGKDGEFFRPDQVYTTADGGASWIKLHDFEHKILVSDVAFVNPTTCYLVCASNGDMILKSIDAGITWDTVYRDTSLSLVSARFTDANNGFVVGDHGKILHTTDGGVTWVDESYPAERLLIAVDVVGTTAWAFGGAGTILKRTEPGSSVRTDLAFLDTWNRESVVITPNPITDISTARLTTRLRNGEGMLILHDMLGNEVRRFELKESTWNVVISRAGLPAGNYYYRLMSGGDNIGTGHVVVQ